jgi:hemerythrin-like metal-binding protein
VGPWEGPVIVVADFDRALRPLENAGEMTEQSGEDTFRVGTEDMQAEHRSQFGMVDTLCDALRQGRDQSEIDDILEQVIDYTHVHFMAEQLLMRLHEYPDSRAHCLEHSRVLEALRALREDVKAGTVTNTLDAIETIRTGLRAHIGGSDLALSNFLGERGVPVP